MSSIIPFDYQAQQVRTVVINGEPWFVAKDVCVILEVGNPSDAVRRLDQDEVDSIEVTDSLGRQQITNIVNEPGLYSLILGSRKPEAKAFKRWITHEVIPAIRKTGSYELKPKSIEDLIILQAQSVKELKNKVEEQQSQLTTLNHRVDTLDSIDLIGDPQQRLNAMIRKYARVNGIQYNVAWNEFVRCYNTAFHTNLTSAKSYLEERQGKSMTRPQYLAAVGRLEDAIRVADKMLNRVG